MKCDNCEHRKFHSAGSFYAVAEGGNDPYDYEYCDKYHWVGDTDQPQYKVGVGIEDQFINCKDFIDQLNKIKR
jgi:hypothetical protein